MLAANAKPHCYLVINPRKLKALGRSLGAFDVFVFMMQSSCNLKKDCERIFSAVKFFSVSDHHEFINISNCIEFIREFDQKITYMREKGLKNLVILAGSGPQEMKYTMFLLGAYMIVKQRLSAKVIAEFFSCIDEKEYNKPEMSNWDEESSLQDWWSGLAKAKKLGWIRQPSFQTPFRWGLIDKDAYLHYDDPLNADLHEIIPGKLLVFRGPRDLGGARFQDRRDERGRFAGRDFSPDYYADLLLQLGVSAVVRVGGARYDRAAFVRRGLTHHDLDFAGAAAPPPSAAAAFLRIVDAAPGAVAVHGRSGGLGRPGALAALCLMRSHGFAAREAAAWARLMRPGAVAADQLRFLERVEDCVHCATKSRKSPGSPIAGADSPLPRRRAPRPASAETLLPPRTAEAAGVGAKEAAASPAAAVPPPAAPAVFRVAGAAAENSSPDGSGRAPAVLVLAGPSRQRPPQALVAGSVSGEGP